MPRYKKIFIKIYKYLNLLIFSIKKKELFSKFSYYMGKKW